MSWSTWLHYGTLSDVADCICFWSLLGFNHCIEFQTNISEIICLTELIARIGGKPRTGEAGINSGWIWPGISHSDCLLWFQFGPCNVNYIKEQRLILVIRWPLLHNEPRQVTLPILIIKLLLPLQIYDILFLWTKYLPRLISINCFLDNVNVPKLTGEQINHLTSPFIVEELSKCIKELGSSARKLIFYWIRDLKVNYSLHSCPTGWVSTH